MALLNLTFGIELELICVYPPDCFKHHDPCPPERDEDGVLRSAGPAVYYAIRKAGILATGYEDLEEDINDDAPSHSRWRVETDVCDASDAELLVIPENFHVEDIELSSRKFDFFRDDWRSEIKAVLDVLNELETMSGGCRFITNESTGFHVHIGNGDEKIPLRAAKNVFQLATAFERCFDLLNTAPRITPPTDDDRFFLYAPPSFFHLHNGDNVKQGHKAMMYDWLATVEERETYEGLGSLFQVRAKKSLPHLSSRVQSGHSSAYNFDNLFPHYSLEDSDLTKTIEFRCHTGTLDILEIVAWVLLCTQMVKYSHEATDIEHLAFCAHGVDTDFGLRDVLSAIGCHPELIAHYLHEEDMVAGLLADSIHAAGEREIEELLPLTATNEVEQLDRSGDVARKAVMDKKDYGFRSSVNIVRIPAEAIARLSQESYIELIRTEEFDTSLESHEERVSKAKAAVYRHLAKMYNGEFSDAEVAEMEMRGPVVVFTGVPDLIADDPKFMCNAFNRLEM